MNFTGRIEYLRFIENDGNRMGSFRLMTERKGSSEEAPKVVVVIKGDAIKLFDGKFFDGDLVTISGEVKKIDVEEFQITFNEVMLETIKFFRHDCSCVYY